MSEETIRRQAPPTWVCWLATVLVGWLVFLFAAILIVIGVSAIASSFDRVIMVGSAYFFGEVAISVLVAGIASYYIGRKAHAWFGQRRPTTMLILTGALLLLTVLSLPMPFTFTVF